MSLLAGYSSDEDGGPDLSKDAFLINSLPVTKKPRVEQPVALAPVAAPHVLSEASFNLLFVSSSILI